MGSTSTKIKLRTSDQKVFEVEKAVAVQSQTIKYIYENGCPDSVIHVHSVSGDILSKILDYCKKHVNSAAGKEDISPEELYEWDANFVKVDQNTLFDLILAANCLKIVSLLDLTCQTVANMIKGKRPEEIRTTFNIKNDYTIEAEEAVRRENKWAFDMLGGVGTMVIEELADDTMSKCVTNTKSRVCVIAANQIVMMRSISKLANKKSIDVYKQPQNPTTPRIKESVKQRNVGTGFIELFFHFKCKM